MSNTSIADYALLSDCHSAALVSCEGSVDWLCYPRFDSGTVFCRILDDRAGHFSIRVAGESERRRRYLSRTLILETTVTSPGGIAVVTEAMAMRSSEDGHDLGADAPRVLLRHLECMEGIVDIEIEFSPRPEYGLSEILLLPDGDGITCYGDHGRFFLSSPIRLEVSDGTAHGRLALKTGETASFALQFRILDEPECQHWSQTQIVEALRETADGWRKWSEMHQAYEGPWRELVHQSGLVLQALTYFPTGAIVAAATTSLPESVGGVRNWDYRFTWVRDAGLTLEALWVAACPDEAYKFFNFLAKTAIEQFRREAELQIMFGIEGELDLTERELPHLEGWRGSRPVRTGNAAWRQRQIDVYGELFLAVHRLRERLTRLDVDACDFLVQVAEAAASRWNEPDHGIWEIRGEPRHFVYSKLMCWVALDRAIALADLLGAQDRVERWNKIRSEIRQAILDHGWNDRLRSFTQAFGSNDLDASNLMMPIVGFLPADDPRILDTLHATEKLLTDKHGLVYRYRVDDGIGGGEGTFLLCTFWLAQAWALAGDLPRAREVFARAAAFANDLGLLSEQADPVTGELLGNFPQAFSHIGLVNAAWAISQGEERR